MEIERVFEAVVEELVTLCDRALVDRIEALELRRRSVEAELAAAISVARARPVIDRWSSLDDRVPAGVVELVDR